MGRGLHRRGGIGRRIRIKTLMPMVIGDDLLEEGRDIMEKGLAALGRG
jgi:hypothetical protein